MDVEGRIITDSPPDTRFALSIHSGHFVRAEAGVDFGQTRRRFRSRANAKNRSISELDGAGQQVFLLMLEKVLCVCLGNISRNPMMQAVLQ
jgi:hypothetical protein